MILYSKVIKSFWCLLLWFINIFKLSSLRRRWFHLLSWLLWFCQESSHVLSLGSFRSNILLRFGSNFSRRLWQQYLVSFGSDSLWATLASFFMGEIRQRFLWTTLTAIVLWALAAILSGQLSHQYFGWDSAAISMDDFDSSIFVRFGSDSLWEAFHSNILGRLDSIMFLISSSSNILVSFNNNFL